MARTRTRSNAANPDTPQKRAPKSSSGGKKRKASPETDDDERGVSKNNDEEQEESSKSKQMRRATRRKTAKDYDSDALDEDSEFDADEGEEDEEEPQEPKRKRASGAGTQSKTPSPRKKRRKTSDADEEEDFELKDGQQVAGVIVQAPKTGRVPPGQISKNTFDFLQKLTDPDCNDREWFKLHEPVYRLAEQEFKDFVESFTEVLVEVDPHIPSLPPKDVIHRIYRDIRFSNDKTPYKKNLTASFSRSGRKGIFAHFASGGESLLAAGTWCPGKNEIATIRSNIARSSDRLRQVISEPAFVKLFGQPKPNKNGGRSSVFGGEDELKVAPKGFAKDHKDIDLLKCRSWAVIHRFKDSEVLDPEFKTKLGEVCTVVRPFVRCLNDLMTLQEDDNNDDDNDNDEES
ncbi:hypothetical protein BDP27DRAFT_1034319 [Rhodocollybia butyracea]|uniref:TIGR02453 family protein n=1 Tax=Rhodocollybia butyracea TaxID=206335 RepID=A0A9P5Q6F4_9AGAR|nr:hypothetical protein BDP27DRAFT_1034319 [Rhodocollybia butyracea]